MKPTHLSQLPFQYATSVKSAQLTNRGLTLELQDDTAKPMELEIYALEENVLRIRLSHSGFIPQPDDSIQPTGQIELSHSTTQETPEEYWIETKGYRVLVGKCPYTFQLFSPEGKLILEENLQDVDSVGEGEDRVPPLGFSYNRPGNPACANLCLSLGVYDRIFGLGERFTEYNKRGQLVVMRNSDTLGVRTELAYKNIPFFLNTAGYGLFVNSTAEVEFHLGTRSSESINLHTPGNQLEYFIFTGTPAQIVSNFTRLTGPALLPPDWSFEVWYSNSFKASSQAEIEADAEILQEKDLPCGVIHLDCYWMRDDHWCDFVWDTNTYPQHQDMLKRLKNRGYHVCVWINPYITIVTQMFQQGKEKGYFVKNAEGEPYTADLWHGLLSPCAMVDFTNPEAAAWFGEKVRGLLQSGIDGIKTDFGEDIPPDSHFANGATGKEMRNLYARLYNETVAQVCRQEKGSDVLLWGRSGCTGMQRYPVCWSGDPHSSYSGMASVLKSGLSIGVSGVPFWSHDIGGFFGLEDPQLFVRWAQFGLLSSHSRFHGTTTRQPWAYGEQAEKIIRNFMHLRGKLMPYILQTAKQCAETGLPFLCPMYLAHPQDPNTQDLWDQYMIGNDLLVAPVFGPHNTARRVYLPQGSWKHYFTGIEYQGCQFVDCTSKLEEIPLFLSTSGKLKF